MTTEEILKETPLFETLDTESLREIAPICSEQKNKPGDVLFKENDEADSILIIKSGLVRISKGMEETEITTLGEGDALGELSFLDSGIRSANAIAVEPAVIIKIPSAKLHDLLEKNLKLAKEFYKGAAHYVSRRLRLTTGDLQFSKEFVAKCVKYF